MHLQLIYFQLTGQSEDQFLAMCERLAPAFADLPGLLGTVWLANPASRTYGAVNLWWDRHAMEQFVRGELFAAVTAPGVVSNATVSDFSVLERPTRTTLGILSPIDRAGGDSGTRAGHSNPPIIVGESESERGRPAMAARPRLEGKVAIVTGAGSRAAGIGNGRATAVLFAREGARVLLVDQSEEAANETLAMTKDEGGEAEVFIADVTNAGDCRAMVERTVARWGRLDILDNNVGIGGAGSVVGVSEEDWDRVMEVNVKSMMLAGKFAIPAMIASGGGSIINISSISALRPRGLTPYSASKGAVIALTRAMAIDHARDGIRVNCIAPGPVYTPMVYAGGMSEELRERRRQASPLGIEGTGWDIGYAALFLASDEARYITGVVLPVDGGVTITSAAR